MHVIFIGNLDYDMQVSDKVIPLQHVCHIIYSINLVKSQLSYVKHSNLNLNKVILTYMPNNCMHAINFNCGISDVHNIIDV